ncbi:flavodoxin [Methanocella sp. CWC-04]|uniref:Flavodoxin n=1 Tax=Methanooceanicella nereidis TaxID=2052831 RepID=A0AAP2RE74_9EURY|nr:flavodoxin family protein [Methanocella sp. CWC-04]MCD1295537.1 flavodoxin [Methanocella sp. CWC-04]
MCEVLYYTMGGSTRKLADAIAGELGVTAKSIKSLSTLPEAEILFLGSGCYGGKPADDMMKFIEGNDFTGRKTALFGASGKGEGKEVDAMEEALSRKGAVVIGKYNCKGRAFLIMNIGFPGKEDFDAAKRFAREMVKA